MEGVVGDGFDGSRARVSQGWPVEKGQQYVEPDSVVIGRP